MDRHLELPQTYDQLLQTNNQLKTRVNELELINMMRTESEARLQKELDSIRKNNEDMKRHMDHLERQLDERNHHHYPPHHHHYHDDNDQDSYPSKRTRLSEPNPKTSM